MVLPLLATREGAQLEVVAEAVGLLSQALTVARGDTRLQPGALNGRPLGLLPLALDGTLEETGLRLLLTALCLLKGALAGELKSKPGGVPGEASDPLLRLLLLVETEEEPLPRSATRAAFLAAVSGTQPSAAARGPPILTLARGEGLTPDRAC